MDSELKPGDVTTLGNLRPGERKTVTVYHVPGGAKAPRHANGAPMTAIATVFQVAKRG